MPNFAHPLVSMGGRYRTVGAHKEAKKQTKGQNFDCLNTQTVKQTDKRTEPWDRQTHSQAEI